MDKEFPTLEDVHVVLSDLTGLFEDRNAMLHTMMKEDKYKDFLLAENLQSMVEADNRDDSRSGGIRTDLANGYEILRAQTTMRRFANFINPASLPIMDLDAPIEFYDDYDEEDEEEVVKEIADTKEDTTDGSNGKPGKDGEDGNTNLNISAPKDNKNITPNNQPDTKLAKGAYVNPATSPLKNSLQTDYKPAKDHGSIKSLEDLGLDGDTNVASEFTEDLGLDKYKAALGNAMGLPLKAVAAGLSGLLSALSMPNTPEFAAAKEQISSISESFDLPKPDMSSEGDTNINNQNNKEQLIAGGGIFSTLTNMFGLAKNKDHQVSPETPMGAAVTGIQNRRQQNEKLIQILSEMIDILTKQGEHFRAGRYKVAQETIMSFSGDITDVNQLEGKKGIGPTILKKLQEFEKTGKIEFINDYELKVILQGKFTTERGRINCSLREASGDWRWLGIQFVISEL